MSPLGIKRFVAILLILSPWVFIPGIFKDIVFILAGILLFISTLDLRRKPRSADHQEVESLPRDTPRSADHKEAFVQPGSAMPTSTHVSA